jgi:phosphoribosylanthranilate isomerase
MKKLVKICGMKDPANIVEVARLSPNWMGFIFYGKSPRFVGNDFVMPVIPHTIDKVGVFVNETSSEILRFSEKHSLSFIQLHGDESVQQLIELKKYNLKIIKAFRIDAEFDFDFVIDYQPHADYFLFDTKGKNYGGNNASFDWTLLKKYNQKVPFLLSGGLNSNNLTNVSALDDMNCAGFDFNSGVEHSPGMKNFKSVKDIMNYLEALILNS